MATRGSTLLEVMVANAILIVVLSATAGSIAFGVRHVGHARHLGEAERIAGAQMEALIAEAHAQAPTVSGRGGFVVQPFRNLTGQQRFDSNGRPDGEGEYLVAWNSEPNRPIPNAQRLSVRVTWQEQGEREFRLATYFVQPNPCDDPNINVSTRASISIGGSGGGEDPCSFETTFGGR